MGTSWRDLIKRWLPVQDYSDYYIYDNVSSTVDLNQWQKIIQPGVKGDNWGWATQQEITTTTFPDPLNQQYFQQLKQWRGLWEQDQKEHDRILLQDIRAKANRYAALLLAEMGCA